MTIIKHFDVPHIVRFGQTDHDPGKSQMLLWRNGVQFIIKVDQVDVQGTDFERQWAPLLILEQMPSFQLRWSELCGLVISHCLDILKELAPNTPYWTSLYEYFHVASYIIRLHSAPGSGVTPRVVEGPTRTCAYEMEPTAWNMFNVPDDLPIFDTRAVTPVNHEQNLRSLPQKVQLPGGKLAFFYPCRKSARHVEDSRVSNDSRQSIASYLRLNSLQIPRDDTCARVPKVLGVLSDSGYPANDMQKEDEKQLAGILLEWIDGYRLINSGLSANREIAANHEAVPAKWREQVICIIRELRRHGVTALRDAINPFDIMIDRNDGHAWLTGFKNIGVSEDFSASDGYKEEQTKIRLVFDQWLSEEADVCASDPQEIRKAAIKRWFSMSRSPQ